MPTSAAIAWAVTGWSPVMSTGVMPASRHAAIVAAAEGRAGSCMPTRPSRRSSRSGSSGTSARSAAATARTRYPRRAIASARASTSVWPIKGSTASGAPLQTTRTPPSGRRCTVVIRLRALSNGTSERRGSRAAGSRPCARAAASSAVSVGSPSATSPVPSPEGRSTASLHSAAAASTSVPVAPSTAHTSRTAIRPSVSVPVLSVAMTVTDPSVSTAGSRRTSALRAAIRRAPSARASVTTAGSDSGTAATTRLIAVITISCTGWPRTSPSTRTTAHSTTAATASARPTPTSRRCNGVRPRPVTISAAMRPIALAVPVADTTARPRPRTTTVPAETVVSVALSTGTDSPVSADSSTSRAAACTTVASAGTMSPSASTSRSPGTTSAVGTGCCTPSRTTRAVGVASAARAVMARSALTSWATPTDVLTAITSAMTAASVQSPVPTVSAAAASSTTTSGSRSCIATRRHSGTRGCAGRRFGPTRSRRAAASTDDSPADESPCRAVGGGAGMVRTCPTGPESDRGEGPAAAGISVRVPDGHRDEQHRPPGTVQHTAYRRRPPRPQVQRPTQRDDVGVDLLGHPRYQVLGPPDPGLQAEGTGVPRAVPADELPRPRLLPVLRLVGERGQRVLLVHVQHDHVQLGVLDHVEDRGGAGRRALDRYQHPADDTGDVRVRRYHDDRLRQPGRDRECGTPQRPRPGRGTAGADHQYRDVGAAPGLDDALDHRTAAAGQGEPRRQGRLRGHPVTVLHQVQHLDVAVQQRRERAGDGQHGARGEAVVY